MSRYESRRADAAKKFFLRPALVAWQNEVTARLELELSLGVPVRSIVEGDFVAFLDFAQGVHVKAFDPCVWLLIVICIFQYVFDDITLVVVFILICDPKHVQTVFVGRFAFESADLFAPSESVFCKQPFTVNGTFFGNKPSFQHLSLY